MKLVITGASGTIGRHFMAHLPQGAKPVALSSSVAGRTRLLANFPDVPVAQVDADGKIHDAHVLEGLDTLLHLAWSSVPVTAELDPEADIRRNLQFGSALLDAAIEAGVRHVIFVSSGGAVYGEGRGAISEEHPLRPLSSYGRAKATFEATARELCQGACRLTILRPGNVYGDPVVSLRPQGVVGHWLQAARAGRPVEVWGGLGTVRDYVHLRDMSAALRAVVQGTGDPYAVYNIGTGVGTSLSGLLDLVCTVTGNRLEIVHRPALPWAVRHNVLDPTRIARDHGFVASVALTTGIEEAWNGLLAGSR